MITRETRLENGFRVITQHRKDVGSVAVGVWVGVGARYERAEHNGIAHFLEHMAFKGTQRRTALDIALEVENRGGQMNAFTAREQTAYYVRLLSEDVALGVDILADILTNSTFASEELERERGVILQEIGQCHDTPNDIVFDYFQTTAFGDQPMGRPILGKCEIIEALQGADFAAFMQEHYHPERMIMVAVGHVDHEALVVQAQETFGQRHGARLSPCEAAHYSGGEFLDERQSEQIHAVLGFPGLSYHAQEHGPYGYLQQDLLSTILGGGMASRLFQEVREKRGLAYAVFSFAQSFRDQGLFGIYAGTGPEQGQELMEVLCTEVRRVMTSPIDDQTLARGKAQLRAGLVMARESLLGHASHLASHALRFGTLPEPQALEERIESISAQQLRTLAQTLFSQPPTLATVGPATTMMPDIQQRLQM